MQVVEFDVALVCDMMETEITDKLIIDIAVNICLSRRLSQATSFLNSVQEPIIYTVFQRVDTELHTIHHFMTKLI